MKNVKFALFLFCGIMIFSCTQTSEETNPDSENVESISSHNSDALQAKLWHKEVGGVIFENRWRGLPNNNCDQEAGDCGACRGFCAAIPLRMANGIELTNEEIINGAGSFKASMDGDDDGNYTFTADLEVNVDNGDGLLIIEEDFFAGTEVSEAFGFAEVILLPGEYEIDYSESEYGKVIFECIVSE